MKGHFDREEYIRMLKYYYSRVNDCSVSKNGEYLLTLLKKNELAIYELKRILQETIDDNVHKNERFTPKVICSLDCSDRLVNEDSMNDQLTRFWASGDGVMKLYNVETIATKNEDSSYNVFPSTTLPLSGATLKVNTLYSTKQNLYSGCDDNNIYIHDKESLKNTLTINAHKDSVTALKIYEKEQTIFSASFDGTVRRWDLRSISDGHVMEILPSSIGSVARKENGRWINALDVSPNMEFLACGGGPKLSLWHCNSGRLVDQCQSDSRVNFVEYSPYDPSIINFTGSEKLFSKWDISKNTQTTIKSSIPNISNVTRYRYDDLDYNLLILSGNSYKIELCKNDTFVDIQLYIN